VLGEEQSSAIQDEISDDYIKENIMRIAKLAAAAAEENNEFRSVSVNSDSYAYGVPSKESTQSAYTATLNTSENKINGNGEGVGVSGGAGVGVGVRGEDKERRESDLEAQETFAKLLKATMDQQAQAADSSSGE
jgi:hypothetical protein